MKASPAEIADNSNIKGSKNKDKKSKKRSSTSEEVGRKEKKEKKSENKEKESKSKGKKSESKKSKSESKEGADTKKTGGAGESSEIEIVEFMQQNGVRITSVETGKDMSKVYPPILSFGGSGFDKDLLSSCSSFDKPTPIQSACWRILTEGKDIVGIAE
ncbi:ATP-dependent RNA helicase dbp3, partial [Smittium mucronatum]